MRTVYVITHPEATHHVEKVVGGWHDSQLTPAGRAAAVRIARTLRDQIPAGADVELFSSDLLRTSQTADEVAREFGVEPILDPRLREKSYGEAEDPGAGLRAPDHRDPRLRTPREDDFYHNRRIISLGDLRHLDD